MYDVKHFLLNDVVECCSAIRSASGTTLAERTAVVARYLHEHLVDKEAGGAACAGVAGFLSDPDGAVELLAGAGTPPTERIMDAVAAFVRRVCPPQFAAVAHVPHVGAGDLIGLAVRLPGPRTAVLVLDMKASVPPATAALLEPLALTYGLAAIDVLRAAEAGAGEDGPWVTARVEMLDALLASHEAAILDQSAVINRISGEAARHADELAASRSALVDIEAWSAAMRATANNALFTIDADGFVRDVNPAAERLFGWRRDEAIGRELAELVIPPPLRDLHRRGLARARSEQGSPLVGRRVEMPAIDRHGNEFPVEISITSVMQGGNLYFTGSVRDLTELKRAERLAAADARAYETLHRIGVELLSEFDTTQLLQTIIDEATEATGAEHGAFLWPGPSAEQGYYVGARSSSPPVDTSPSLADATDLLGPTFLGDVVRVDDLSHDGRVRGGVAGHGLPWGSTTIRSYLAVPVIARAGDVLAALVFGHARSAVFDERDVRLAAGIAAQAAVAIENARLYQATEHARRAAERAAQNLACLQELSQALAGQMTLTEVADVAVTHVRDTVDAERAAMWVVNGDGDLTAVAGAGWDSADLEPFRVVPRDARLPITDALRTDELVLLGTVTERNRRYPNLVHIESANAASIAAIPLVFEQRALGAIAVTWAGPRMFDTDDRRLLGALGDNVVQALERARLYEAEREAAAHQTFLARAGVALASSLDYQATLARVARLAVPELADSCTIHLVDQGRLPVVGLAHRDPELEDLLRRLSAQDDTTGRHDALYEVARTGRPLLVPDVPVEIVVAGSVDDSEAEARARLGIRSGLAVPLVARGQTLGVLALTMGTSGRRFDEADLRVVEELARRAALAIDNARTFAVRSDAARTLQTSLLPPSLPDVPGVELAARYRPVEDGSLVGGDFYDAFPIGDGRWGLVLGDVSGKGVAAASLTALARYTIRALAGVLESPAAVLHSLNRAVLDYGASDRYCTVAYLVLEPATNGVRITIARGGHPAPMRVRPDGTVAAIGVPGTGIGLLDAPDVTDTVHDLEPGDLLVLYTDGITDARNAEGRFAGEILPEVLAGLAGNFAEGAASILEGSVLNFTGGAHRDDMAVVVARVLPPANDPPE